jgi:hypothetical protein
MLRPADTGSLDTSGSKALKRWKVTRNTRRFGPTSVDIPGKKNRQDNDDYRDYQSRTTRLSILTARGKAEAPCQIHPLAHKQGAFFGFSVSDVASQP